MKQRIQLFESVPKAPVKSKAVYIPKENPEQNIELLYRNALRNIMNPLFIFASIYASIQLILAVFNFKLNNC